MNTPLRWFGLQTLEDEKCLLTEIESGHWPTWPCVKEYIMN